MTQEAVIYALDSADQLTNWAERIAIATNAKILSSHEELVDITFLDSFDWLFYSAGVQLLAESRSGVDGKKILLRWVSGGSSKRSPAVLYLDRLPKTAADLPTGQMYDCINKQLGFRSLLPVASVHSKQIKLAILDKENKTRCRLILEHNYARPRGHNRSIDLGCRLRLEALLGYEKVFNKASKSLGKLKGVRRTQDDIFKNAVIVTGRTPGDYSSKIQVHLRSEWRVDRACREILLAQLNQLEKNIEGTIANTDTEFLHDLRVATRRSRALLSRMKNAFPKSICHRFSKELAWVGEITTPLRDLDVFMINFPVNRDSLVPELRANLAPFYEFLCTHHKAEQAVLIKHFNSRRFANFRTKWRAYLEKPLPIRPRAGLSTKPIGEVADKRIWKTYRRLIREGKSITPDSPAEDLHELRKTCKKLRYLLEAFASLYSKKEIKKIINSLKILQENLGDFQDLYVQATKLRDFSQVMSEEGETRKEVFIAIRALIKNMLIKKKLARAEFAQRFSFFATAQVEKEFRRLCRRDISRDRKDPKKKKELKRNKTVGLTK